MPAEKQMPGVAKAQGFSRETSAQYEHSRNSPLLSRAAGKKRAARDFSTCCSTATPSAARAPRARIDLRYIR